MLNWYTEFLTGRNFKVVVGGTFSNTFSISTGVPQGAVSSPTLFNIAMHDVPRTPQVVTSVFADDVSMYTVQKTLADAESVLQEAVNQFRQWCLTWGLEVNPGKSSLMYFSRKRFFRLPAVLYGDELIPIKKQKLFLGLLLDSPSLTWEPHVNLVRQKCSKRLNLLKALGHSKFGCSRRVLMRLYTACIRSVIDYGYPIYGSTSPTNYSKLQIIQNSAVRIILGAWRSSPIIDMHGELALPMLSIHHKDVALKYLWKIQNYPAEHPVFQKVSSNFSHMISSWETRSFKHKVPFIKRSQDIARDLDIACSSFYPHEEVSPIPPWESLISLISTSLLTPVKGLPSTAKVTSFLVTLAFNYPDYTFIYTDGSKMKMEDVTFVGAAIYISELPLTLKWRLDPEHSVISAELYAILQALIWIKNYSPVTGKYVICSDSCSGLQLISQRKPSLYKDLIYRIHSCLATTTHMGINLRFQWTPAHCGIQGNEAADDAAKSAYNLNIVPHGLDKGEKTSLHRSILQQRVYQDWETLAPNLRLGKFKPKFEKWPWAERSNRHEDTLLSNFRLGNPPLNKYLYKAKILASPNCNWCPGIIEDSEHFFLRCRLFTHQRKTLLENLRRLNVREPTLIILLGGGGFSPQKNKKILDLTCAFCRSTKRFKSL